VKRHGDHHHHSHESHHHFHDLTELTKVYVERIFEIYGVPGDQQKMNVLGFEKILDKLNLHFLKTEVHDETPEGCVRGLEFVEKITTEKSEKLAEYKRVMGWNHEHHDHDHSDHDHEHHEPEPSANLPQLLREVKESLLLEPSDMKAISPILLYHFLTNRSSLEQQGCINLTLFNTETHEEMESRTLVWVYSTLAVIGVSLCGLLGVAVIPIMEKHFYHHVIQFLVALAVGTLCGDALLHLIPHAMMTSNSADDIHESMMYKGLASVLGIVVFYFFERFLTMVTEWRQKKMKRDKPSSRVRVMRDPENAPAVNGGTGEKQCKHKYSSYPYCYDEIAMDITKDDHHEHNHVENHRRSSSGRFDQATDPITPDIAQNLIKKPAVNGAANNVDVCNFNKNNSFTSDVDNNTVSTNLDDGSIESNLCLGNNNQSLNATVTKPLMQEENYTIILR
jgi:zinc transporter 10